MTAEEVDEKIKRLQAAIDRLWSEIYRLHSIIRNK